MINSSSTFLIKTVQHLKEFIVHIIIFGSSDPQIPNSTELIFGNLFPFGALYSVLPIVATVFGIIPHDTASVIL
jgi:hypothetical protein